MVVASDSRQGYLGIAAGFFIAALGLAGSIYLISDGHGWAGVALGGADLTALTGVFIYGVRARQAERWRNDSEK